MSTEVRKCSVCGNIIHMEGRFCPACGSLLKNAPEVSEPETEIRKIDSDEIKKRLSQPGVDYNGRKICTELRNLRIQFAEANGLDYEEKECTNQEPCSGTCPYCEQKLEELNQAAGQAGIEEPMIYPEAEVSRIIVRNSQPILMGMMRPPENPMEQVQPQNNEKSENIFGRIKKFLRK